MRRVSRFRPQVTREQLADTHPSRGRFQHGHEKLQPGQVQGLAAGSLQTLLGEKCQGLQNDIHLYDGCFAG